MQIILLAERLTTDETPCLQPGNRLAKLRGNFPMSRPAVLKHLRLLRSAGLVVARKDGTANLIGLNAKPLRLVDDWRTA
jgi:DNA-binding transcriptional ArsR family regulator